MLMDRVFRAQGVNYPSPLDRLAFIGDRAMGALTFAPPAQFDIEEPDWNLLALAHESERAMTGNSKDALQKLALKGGSPQGARPKSLVQFDVQTGQVSSLSDAVGEPWLVKFPSKDEHKEVCAIEQMYASLARDCGLEMPPSEYFDLTSKLAAFGVARFDRRQKQRIPVQSLAGFLDIDFRLPGSVDYTKFLRATSLLTRDEREVEKAYERAVFNVLFHNRDDHPKNIAWILGSDRRWKLSPAFDLTFSEGPMGQHHMDICGEGSSVQQNHMLRLAEEGGVSNQAANLIIDRMLAQAETFSSRFEELPIRNATKKMIISKVAQCMALLASPS